MDEKLKEAQKRLVEFWKKYDKKQKTIIISIKAVVLVALIILAVILTKTEYVTLIECDDTVSAANIATTLDGEAMEYKTENDGLTILVAEENYEKASYLIAQSGYTSTLYSYEDYMEDGGFSATSTDRERGWQRVLEDRMKATVEGFDYVKSASVMFTMPPDKLSILDHDEETYVSVKLSLKGEMPNGAADSLARFVATAVGNPTTNSITIIDNSGRTLFQGSNSYEDDGTPSVSKQNEIRDRFNNEVINNVSKVLMATGLYSTVTVSPTLDFTFDKVDKVTTEYFNPDEVLDNEYIYQQEGGTSSGGIPGTDSNDDDTGYMIELGEGSNNSVMINKNDYAVSSTITSIDGERGKCDRTQSYVGVTVNMYEVHDRATLEKSGALDDMTWEEYIAKNKTSKPLEITEGIKELVKAASGIPMDNIEITGWIIPVFEDTTEEGTFVKKILPIILAVIILALLGFMVWRSLRPVEITEVEPELSVEELLSATRDKQQGVEEIDLEEKSETGKAIEKFVDENPEAAALLLRNWLNDDWG